MSLFEGGAPPNIESTRVTGATAPQYLTDYLTSLAQAGQQALPTAGQQLVAEPSFLQKKAYEIAPSALTRYTGPLGAGVGAATAAAAPITQGDISAFYNPYEQQVVDAMARQSAENVQRGLLPQLRGAFAGTGGFGGQRYAGAMGQSLADIQQGLLSEQSKYRAAGYQSALDAAMKQRQMQSQAAQVLGGLAGTEQQAVTTGLKTLSDLGSQQQALEQARIEAPLVRAQNVAQIMRGYTYPTTTTETYKGPGNIYQPSPLSQIAGLGALLGSGVNKSGTGWLEQIGGFLGGLFKNTPGSSTGSEYWWPEGQEGGP